MDGGELLGVVLGGVSGGVVAFAVARYELRHTRAAAAEERWRAAWERLRPIGNAIRWRVAPGQGPAIRDAAEALRAAIPARRHNLRRLAAAVAAAAIDDEREFVPAVVAIRHDEIGAVEPVTRDNLDEALDRIPQGLFQRAWRELHAAMESAIAQSDSR